MATITERIDATTRIPPRFLRADPPAPCSVKIEISPRCNYRCGFCALRTREKQPKWDMDFTLFKRIISAAATLAMLAAAVDAAGQQQTRQREQEQQRTQERAGKREIIPGSELMTSAEREAYRQRHAAAKSDAERDKVRAEHVKAMEERARVRGLQLAPPVAPKGDGK